MAKYTKVFKIKVCKNYFKNGARDTMRVYNVSNTAIYKWIRQYEEGNFMRKENKKYTIKEKIEIIKYFQKFGLTETGVKYNISKSVLIEWKKKYEEHGLMGLNKDNRGRPKKPKLAIVSKDLSDKDKLIKELQYLRMENAALKKLAALVQNRKK